MNTTEARAMSQKKLHDLGYACGVLLGRGQVLTSTDIDALAEAYELSYSQNEANIFGRVAVQKALCDAGVQLKSGKYRGRVMFYDESLPLEDRFESYLQAVAQIDTERSALLQKSPRHGESLQYVVQDTGSDGLPPFSLVVEGGLPEFKPGTSGGAQQRFRQNMLQLIYEQRCRRLGYTPSSSGLRHGGAGAVVRTLLTGTSDILPRDRCMVEPIPEHGVTFHDPNFSRVRSQSGSGSVGRMALEQLVTRLLEPDLSSIRLRPIT